MQLAMSAEARKRRKKERKKQKKQKKQGWKRRLLNWISGLMHRLFGSTTKKELISEAVTFYSENHSHIVCEHAKHKFVPVLSFLAGKKLLKSYHVPGKVVKSQINVTEKTYPVPGKVVKTQINVTEKTLTRFLIGVFVRFEILHSEGKTLNGCFSAESICVPHEDLVITPHIDVRFDSLPLDAFQPYTDKGGNLDLMRLGSILEHDILSSETDLPCDLKQLLDLLRSDPVSMKSLIYSHISLKGLKQKLSYYMWMYKRLLYLKKKHHDKYNKIMQKISVDEGWRGRASDNKYLVRFRPKGRYSKDGEGESRFYRNSVEHLPKFFEENNTKLAKKNESLLESQKKGSQPALQQNGAIAAAQRTGSHPEANKKETQLASNEPTAQINGPQQSASQPASQRNGAQPIEHKKGAQAGAQTKGTQLAIGDDEEEGELQEYHTAIVLLDTFPKFLGDLQKALYEENELESCNAEGPVTGKNTVCSS